MKAEFYHLPEIFEKEKSYIVQNCWLLVAHKNELKNNFDFVTYDFLGLRIFVQNFEGNIKAFQNICLHRFNPIHQQSHGNRPPVCRYHSWSYSADGCASGIPNRKAFKTKEIENLCLPEYEVDFCGSFVFVKLNRNNYTTLGDYLGILFNDLETLSRHYNDKISDFVMPYNCNWKLAVENVKECYHCSSIHKNSFFKMGYGSLPAADIKIHNGSSYCLFPKKEATRKNVAYEKLYKCRTYQQNGYRHYVIFPNTFISSTEGILFYIGSLIPLNSSSSHLRIRNFGAKFIDAENSLQDIINYMHEQSPEATKIILDEDREVIEAIQKNVASTNNTPILGSDEERIQGFHKFIKNDIYKI